MWIVCVFSFYFCGMHASETILMRAYFLGVVFLGCSFIYCTTIKNTSNYLLLCSSHIHFSCSCCSYLVVAFHSTCSSCRQKRAEKCTFNSCAYARVSRNFCVFVHIFLGVFFLSWRVKRMKIKN